MIEKPTEITIVQAAAAVIAGTQLDDADIVTKVVPRWILALAVGEAVSHLAPKDGDGKLLPINSWVLTTSSWIPSKAKSESGLGQTPKAVSLFPDIFEQPDAVPQDDALARDYKIEVSGTLKIWQLAQYKQGNDSANSELESMRQRQAVIDEITSHPRLGMQWHDLEHDELKFPSIAILPFDGNLIHVAQGNLPFSFSYVVHAA